MIHFNPSPERPWYRSRAGLALLVFLGIGGYFLVTEHWAHVVPWLPWALLLACPLLHVFLHGGHAGHEDGNHAGHGQGPSATGGQETGERDPSTPSKHKGHGHD